MDIDIISIDTIVIEQTYKEPITLLINEKGSILGDMALEPNRGFGIIDQWKIRSLKRHFTFYR